MVLVVLMLLFFVGGIIAAFAGMCVFAALGILASICIFLSRDWPKLSFVGLALGAAAVALYFGMSESFIPIINSVKPFVVAGICLVSLGILWMRRNAEICCRCISLQLLDSESSGFSSDKSFTTTESRLGTFRGGRPLTCL